MDYNGERFLDILYKELYKSKEVLHTKEKNDIKEESIKRYMDRLESIHDKANTKSKKNLIKSLYFKNYVIKKENLPWYMGDNEKQGIIETQKKSLSTWIDYLTDENAKYPMWAKYWVFHQMLKMGTYDEINDKYTKRTNKTINPFIEANPEIIAKCIGNLIKLLGNEKLSTQEIRKLVSNISFEKMYIEYQKNKKKRYKSNEGIWIKYKQGSIEDAIKLSSSLEGKNTGWCTANEETAINQLCGKGGYIGGDFYVYYTKDEDGNYKMPRIAIRLDGHENIGEIRGVEEHQNLEEEMIPILESKLKDMSFLSKNNIDKYMNKINDLKDLVLIKEKTLNGIELTDQEKVDLYIKDFGFGWENDQLVKKIMERRNFVDDYKSLKDVSARKKVDIITGNFYLLNYSKAGKFLNEKSVIKMIVRNIPDILKFVVPELLADKDFVLELTKKNGYTLEYVNDELKNDKEVVLSAVSEESYALQEASERLKNDKEVIKAAIIENGHSFQFASTELKKDKEFIFEMLKFSGCIIGYIDDELKENREIVLAAVKNNGLALKDANKKFKNDKEIVLEAVRQNYAALQYMDIRFSFDEDIILEAAKKSADYAISFCAEELKNNKEFLMKIIDINPGVIEYLYKILVPKKYAEFRELALFAVNKDWKVLKDIPNEAIDYDIILAAIKQNITALDTIPIKYIDDFKFILKAMKINKGIFKYILNRKISGGTNLDYLDYKKL